MEEGTRTEECRRPLQLEKAGSRLSSEAFGGNQPHRHLDVCLRNYHTVSLCCFKPKSVVTYYNGLEATDPDRKLHLHLLETVLPEPRRELLV